MQLRVLGVFFLACAFLLTLPIAAKAVSRNVILEPYEDDLARCKDALSELQRQASLHLKERQQHLAFLEERREDFKKAEDRMRQEFAAHKKALDRAVLAGWQLINDLDDSINIPLQGFVTIDEMRQRREAHLLEMQEQLLALEAGDMELQIAGLGILSRNSLEERIQADKQELEALQKVIEAGEYMLYYPGLGEVTRTQLESNKSYLEERIKGVSTQIASGDYVLVLPHLGPLSKNDLDARIAALQEDMKNLKQRFKDGKEKILRANMQWSNAAQLKQMTDALEEDKKQLRQALKEERMEYLLPTGWASEKTLKQRIASLQESIAGVESELANKTYEVALPDGTWANEKELDLALINAVIAPDIREALEKGRKNIVTAAGAEMQQQQIEADKLQSWLQSFPELAAPHLALLDLKLKWKKAMLDEFRREETAATRWMQERLRWLQSCRRSFP